GFRSLDSAATIGFLMILFKGEILMQFHIEGMTCGGCAGKIVKAIHSVDPHAEVITDPPPGISWQVEGMDCASCIGKIETALARMPGVSDIRLNFATEKLELTLAPGSSTQVGDVEQAIRGLGFGVAALAGSGTASDAGGYKEPAVQQQRWWQTARGRQVVGLGVLMGAAYLMARLFPGYGDWV